MGSMLRLSRGIDSVNLSPLVAFWVSYLAVVGFVTIMRHRILLSVSSLFLVLGCVEVGVLAFQEVRQATG